jgi:hypothetical protein
MNLLECASLGETWMRLVELTVRTGVLRKEGYEAIGVEVAFPGHAGKDAVISQFGDPHMIAEMRKVFFENSANSVGHSYCQLMRGPGGRNDFEDIISLLRADPLSKRAVMTLCGEPGGKVPCINVIQFLVRDDKVQTIYFARGQDAFKKFYADALCIAAMADKVSRGLGCSVGMVQGYIGSSHVYNEDMPAIERMLGPLPLVTPAGRRGGAG